MLFKMLGLERTWQVHQDSMPRPRQVFVTQSRMLAGKVEEYFVKMLESLAAGAQSPKELAKHASIGVVRDEGLVDLDDEENWRSDLPKRFSELRDNHFPLFVTFDKVSFIASFGAFLTLNRHIAMQITRGGLCRRRLQTRR
jgi:hypothetical protein